MRTLAKHEVNSVSGAALKIDGCIYHVSSKYIPKREFDLIESTLQNAYDGTISIGQARQILDDAGVSQRSIELYMGNIPSKPTYCV